MQWTPLSAFEPALPPHCEPTNDFLLRVSSTFHTCIPTPQAFTSNALGFLSIAAWLFAQLPQIYKNWSISSTSGLSIYFLVEWCLGDLSNLLGALFTHQASWQVAIGSYYVFVDICLVTQWFWYEKLRHGRIVRRVQQIRGGGPDDWSGGGLQEVIIEGAGPYTPSESGASTPARQNEQERSIQGARPQIIFRSPTYEKHTSDEKEKAGSSYSATPRSTTIHRLGQSSSPMPSPSPRTVLLIVCLAAMAQAGPVAKPPETPSVISSHHPTPLENAGTILSWMSTILYLGSRLPQLIKNWRRKSTAGLSPLLFAAAFCGNLFYSLALATNPCGWNDFGPYGGRGWVGPEGSDRAHWIAAALPFFLGAAGVLGMDGSVGLQFMLYGEGNSKVMVVEERKGRQWRWRKVSGWMRGWVPSFNEGKGRERQALMERNNSHGQGYGAL
jgi:solute carrier family 66 (lysosomal lysine-arginine transporter), member 1